MQPKSNLRRAMRARRRTLPLREQRLSAVKLACRVRALPLFKNSRRIAFYYPHGGEIDPTELITRAWNMKKRCYLPVLLRLNGNRLRFAPIRPGAPLVTNRYGIPEPAGGKRRWQPANNMDLILVPLVAFDTAGNRLGMGGGYYDRTLAFLARRYRWRKPRLLGLAYDFQRVDRLETDPWDIPMVGIATDTAYYPGFGS